MTPLILDRVRRAIERDRLLPPGCRVAAAVSGGADSVALLWMLHELEPDCGFTLAGVIHYNHQLRGNASDGDEAFCRDLGARIGIPVEVGSGNVAALAREARVSIEVAARRARHVWFVEAAGRLSADVVATGHTLDDQAETFLLRVLRGAGASGLAGIQPRRGSLVRPLLDIRRHEIERFLADADEPHREDASNHDLTIPRNWVRLNLLPFLGRHLNADVSTVLARQALLLRDESSLLDDLAEQARSSVESQAGAFGISLDTEQLMSLPLALARRVVRAALVRVDDARFLGFDHVEQVLVMAADPTPGQVADLPGIRVERKATAVVLQRREARGGGDPMSFHYRIPMPGQVEIPESGCTIDVSAPEQADSQMMMNIGITPGDEAVVDAEVAADGLWVRSRLPGDALRPLGLRGRKKLQDVLVDRKVPREERDRVPIVVDAKGRIVWVAGHVISDEARVTDRTQTVVTLKLRRLGEI